MTEFHYPGFISSLLPPPLVIFYRGNFKIINNWHIVFVFQGECASERGQATPSPSFLSMSFQRRLESTSHARHDNPPHVILESFAHVKGGESQGGVVFHFPVHLKPHFPVSPFSKACPDHTGESRYPVTPAPHFSHMSSQRNLSFHIEGGWNPLPFKFLPLKKGD